MSKDPSCSLQLTKIELPNTEALKDGLLVLAAGCGLVTDLGFTSVVHKKLLLLSGLSSIPV